MDHDCTKLVTFCETQMQHHTFGFLRQSMASNYKRGSKTSSLMISQASTAQYAPLQSSNRG